MERQQILDAYNKMRKKITDTKDDYLEIAFKYIKNYFNIPKEKWNWETFSKGIEDIIYQSLTDTYSITIEEVKKIYNIKFTEVVNRETIEELTYSKDGKSLSERLESHFNEAKNRENSAIYFFNRFALIMNTETLYASNHVIHGKLKKYATHIEVIGSPECQEMEEGFCEYYISRGKMPIEELDELPPYHPDCECEVIYYFE